MKKKLTVLTALLLTVSMLFSGCALLPVVLMMGESVYPPETAYADSPDCLTEPLSPDWVPVEPVERDPDPIYAPTSFDEMAYERPDADALRANIAAVQTLVEQNADADDVLDAFYAVYDDYRIFSTMATLSYIHYTLDLEDDFYVAENAWCDEQSPLVSQALEKCYIAMAGSSIRDELEAECFGEGFFEFYDENQIYNDRVVALMQKEAALETEYTSLQSNMTITWQGEERLVDEVIEATSMDYYSYLEVYRLYYEKYNPLVSDIFVRLIRVRREIAAELGYDSYADFAYAYTYSRDYTPAQAAAYTDAIAENMGDLYYYALYAPESERMDTETSFALLKDTAYTLGGEFAEAFDYMRTYGLYDLTESSQKMPGSYMTYLSAYEMPYLYVSPTGTSDDLLTEAHEFGHFVDGYVNCDTTTSIDCAEIFSQGLEYLTLSRAVALTDSQRENMTASKISDAILVFLCQSCYAAFEQAAYELPDEKLNAEGLNELFQYYSEIFGMGAADMEGILDCAWIDIQHFIIAPFYVISYCISNDAALQIYQRELSTGDGLALYRELLSKSSENTILNLLDETGMESPFADGRVEELTDFLTEKLFE